MTGHKQLLKLLSAFSYRPMKHNPFSFDDVIIFELNADG